MIKIFKGILVKICMNYKQLKPFFEDPRAKNNRQIQEFLEIRCNNMRLFRELKQIREFWRFCKHAFKNVKRDFNLAKKNKTGEVPKKA